MWQIKVVRYKVLALNHAEGCLHFCEQCYTCGYAVMGEG